MEYRERNCAGGVHRGSAPGSVKSGIFPGGFQAPIAKVAKLLWKEMKCIPPPPLD